ncbi:MAG: hypothetical protein GY894_10810 [Planctomycetes bacterium]|nr:hypothetical protein [Planctomycetota bacterium]
MTTREMTQGSQDFMELRLGHLLVRNGILESSQVDRALIEQDRTGEPFGATCERLFGIDPRDVERAWADQYASLTQKISLRDEVLDSEVLSLLTRRQAWQFGAMPIRWDGGELMVATTSDLLVRAHRFLSGTLTFPVFFVMTSREDLAATLQRVYPLPGGALPSSEAGRGRTAA